MPTISYKAIHRSDLKESFIISGIMYVYNVLFALFGVLFIYMDGVGGLIHFLIGLAFFGPLMVIYFFEGIKEGDREFKKLNYEKLNTKARLNLKKASYTKGVLYVLPYVGIGVFFVLIMLITDWQLLKMLMLWLYVPATKIGQAFNWVGFTSVTDKATKITTYTWTLDAWAVAGIVVGYLLITALVFWMGYMKKINDARDQFSAFITEIVENERYRTDFSNNNDSGLN